jgi:hypothetical protein
VYRIMMVPHWFMLVMSQLTTAAEGLYSSTIQQYGVPGICTMSSGSMPDCV